MANALPQSTTTRSRRCERATPKSPKRSKTRPSNKPVATTSESAAAQGVSFSPELASTAPQAGQQSHSTAKKPRPCPRARVTSGRDWDLRKGDALYHLKQLPDNSVQAVITDPPYGYRGGIYGLAWDRKSLAHKARFWQEASRVLVPGGAAVSFAAASTYHRLACAMEDGGLEFRDQLMWLKAHSPAKGGVQRMVSLAGGDPELFAGFEHTLRPGHEPIALARKPLDGTLGQNLKKWGTGALNLRACSFINQPSGGALSPVAAGVPARNPSTVVLSTRAAALVDQQSGYSKSRRNNTPAAGAWSDLAGGMGANRGARGYDDEGGLGRAYYRPRTSKTEKQFGLPAGVKGHETTKPLMLMRWLTRMVMPPVAPGAQPGLVLDPFAGSGSTGGAALLEGFRFIGFEQDTDSVQRARRRLHAWEQQIAERR